MSSEEVNVFSLPINTRHMKEGLDNIPKDELVLRVIACCNEIEQERKEYNAAVDEINRLKMEVGRWEKNFNSAIKMVQHYQNKN